ncbi:MAG TPA: pitrilysin family protein [Candidatus Eisenbacteria bacterium]
MHRRPFRILGGSLAAALALLFVVATPLRVAAQPSSAVVKEVLPNGLTLLMQEDHSKPLVGVCIFVNGGSRTEDPTLSGLSHYYEHLIFRGGSVRQNELEFRKQMQRIGEESGGYTTNDYTCYGFTAPAANLDEALWRSVDAWMGLKLTQAKVDRERQVVMEEYNQGEDRPDYKVYYQIEHLMFHDHPYKRDTIGLKDVIEHASLATFRTFYAERYVPNQMILSAVGDFEPRAMRAKIERAFAAYARGKSSFEQGLVEKPQGEFRMGVESMKTPNTWTIVGFHVPPYGDADAPALTVVASLLGHGNSSRLYHALKDKQNLVTDVSADLEVRKDPGMFTINAQMPPANEAKVFGIVRDELTRLATEPTPQAELDRVKTALVNDDAFAAQTHFARAERLCLFGLMADASVAALWPKLIQSVTAEDVRRVARRYFGPDLASYSVVRPADASGGPGEADVRAMVDAWKGAWPAGGAGTTVAAAAAPRRETLPNGLTLLLKEDHAIPIVAVTTLGRGGQWIEPDGKAGVSNMAAALLVRGAGSMTARDISDRADALGMRLTSGGSADYASVSWQAPSSALEKAWDLYRAVLTAPTFPATEVAKVREDLTQQVKSLGDRPFEFTNVRFAQALYKSSPYRRATIGDEASLAKITTADLRKAYETMFCGSNLVVSVVGDFDSDAVLAMARKTLGTIPKGAPAVVGGVKDEAPAATNAAFVPKDQEQITYNTGWIGCSILDPDYVALRTGVSLIGDRLFFKYVYEKGVAYRSWFYMVDRLGQASVQNEMGVTPSNWDMASRGVLDDVASFVKGPITDADVKTAVDKILARYYLGAQEDADVAYRLGFYEMAGLGYQFADRYPEQLRKVTAAEVAAALRKYLKPDAYTRVAVGNEPKEAAGSSSKPAK